MDNGGRVTGAHGALKLETALFFYHVTTLYCVARYVCLFVLVLSSEEYSRPSIPPATDAARLVPMWLVCGWYVTLASSSWYLMHSNG
ncbi:hypothetical protein F4802DRAFT_553744 [Xylaria palmicola]|nr:hypothetical protein F4802DRAFT_553744 [Xylaria palmicola]